MQKVLTHNKHIKNRPQKAWAGLARYRSPFMWALWNGRYEMCSFIQESLKPEIFWTALASLGTLAAVLVALFLPMYNERKRIKKVKKLIEGEILRNYQITKNTNNEHTITLPNGTNTKVVLRPDETYRLLRLNLWEEYKYKLADDSPQVYETYQNICQHIEALSKLEQVKEEFRPIMFQCEINSFLKKCREILKFN